MAPNYSLAASSDLDLELNASAAGHSTSNQGRLSKHACRISVHCEQAVLDPLVRLLCQEPETPASVNPSTQGRHHIIGMFGDFGAKADILECAASSSIVSHADSTSRTTEYQHAALYLLDN